MLPPIGDLGAATGTPYDWRTYLAGMLSEVFMKRPESTFFWVVGARPVG
ncbi:hypothetical protein [Aeoliella sp. SH292]